MGRLVRIPREASRTLDPFAAGPHDFAARRTPGDSGLSASVEQDDYLLRLAKYVPAEILAFSILINAILDQALRDGGNAAAMAGIPVTTIARAALVIGTLMAPFYVWYVREKEDAWVTHAFVSFVAFPVWSYALGAVAFADYWDGNLAAMLLATFSVVSGMITPLPFEAARNAPRPAAVAARRLAEVIAMSGPEP